MRVLQKQFTLVENAGQRICVSRKVGRLHHGFRSETLARREVFWMTVLGVQRALVFI